ncbi:glycoside hydrolase family 43 protein [Pinibacter aurantiacus]|uniref:Glycoside hydrolase family 43 protein n=1 Tax=Pinibacter aurantiacus TaxID=2851599 RepID=A0A9E2W4M0_9BACT|nr:glycoside hydrolase family 43 protein [Pinibacter aurantiacus]MBV4357648.1 glycoside hydrolase family 43 protein [Pinibacter aurantiacus]
MKRISIIFFTVLLTACSAEKSVYMFTSFHEPATDGLRLMYSADAYHWKAFDTTFLQPEVGQKVMRDPSMIQGPDGVFRLVWTSGWNKDKGFGYASSKDLIHWSHEQFIPVMESEPTTVNVWAPELFYDDEGKQYIIIWASCIPGRFEKGEEAEDNNHRLYYTTTKDFKTFSPSKLFFDQGFSAIDATMIKRGKDDYVLVVKDNTRPNRNIKVCFAKSPLGPFTQASQPFTDNFCEGPSAAKTGNDWLIYFDAYRAKKYSAVRTTDFKTFENVDSLLTIPEGHKHGTVFMVTKKTLKNLKKHAAVVDNGGVKK